MNPFEMVVVIVALGVLGGIITQYLDSRSKRQKKVSEQQQTEILQRLEQAEQRIRILERIVTSDDYDLKRQFRDLEKD